MNTRHYGGASRKSNRTRRTKTLTGVIQANEKGFAFLIPDDKDSFAGDFFIPKSNTCGALDGDRVLCEYSGHGDEARVKKILSRGLKRVVGTLDMYRSYALLTPDNRRHPVVKVPKALLNGAADGDKVVVEITSYLGGAPVGKVAETLGKSGELIAEELAVIKSYNLEESFPAEVRAEARKVCRDEIIFDGREDLRDRLIFTIDGADTRDIDDAVSLDRDGENYVLGVHIADVSRYVKFGSTLDKDAYSRGTSVYFPDRVLPMLPEELSNGACSLNENEEKYALSCIMTFDKTGKRLNYRLCESVIKSSYRLTYFDVNAVLSRSPWHLVEFGKLLPVFENMKELCEKLEQKRQEKGCVNLDIKESHIYYDGFEISIPDTERTLSERMIEQFMISANECVAEFLSEKRLPCLYRIHEPPEPDKAAAFAAFLSTLGVSADFDIDEPEPRDFQKILDAAKDKPVFSVVNKVMLRTMQKAKYSPENAGHFGLASGCYCHFTSPIRRYPDLFCHRVLKDALHGSFKSTRLYGGIAAQAGIDCSQRERTADEAERKVDDIYKLAYMSERIGEIFPATVSGVTAFGVFCELENGIEGLIPLEDLPQDCYEFYEERYLLKGAKNSYRIGDALTVRAASCDRGRLKTLFALAEIDETDD